MTSVLTRPLHRLSTTWLPFYPLSSIPTSPPRPPKFSQNLPLELERYILELALFSQSQSAAINLLLVAHRARVWLEPLLYNTVILNTHNKAQRFVATLQTRPESYFKTHVKSLLIRADDAVLHPVILTTCSNVRQLTVLPASQASTLLHPLLQNLTFPNLSNLTINLDSSFGVAKIDFSLPIFRQVTHMQVHNSLVRAKTAWNGIACVIADENHDDDDDNNRGHMQSSIDANINGRSDPTVVHSDAVPGFLPNLTHLSMQGLGFSSAPHILELCPRLNCLVFERHPDHAVGLEIEDPRFVRGNPRENNNGGKAEVATKNGGNANTRGVGVIEGMGAEEVVFGWWEEMEYWATADEAVAKNWKEYEEKASSEDASDIVN
ncbi:hypothetical protein BDN72DRAFT_395067 [Pluteus cervinus]|uniref:Uncharacterized protein n=1 Tax=Pluteus cervinus TaxID=181527 RepID=A0ACD3B139_9AGAR|nr:hypothetical protein BDN72DRAFT_395067 [Pluteus cervinus]